MNGSSQTIVNIAGKQLNGTITKTDQGQSLMFGPRTLPVGFAGTLTTRTDNDTGVVTAAGHTIISAELVDVYWADGIRYGMVATVAGDAVTVDGGAGDVLPAQDTVTNIVKQVVIDFDVDGDDLSLIAVVASGARTHIEFATNVPATIAGQEIVAGGLWQWASGQGITNPLAAAAVGMIRASCGSATVPSILDGACLFDDIV